MSTNTSALAKIDPNNRTASLLAALQGMDGEDAVITEGLDAEMAQAMDEDYADVRLKLQRIQLKNGAYQNRDTEQRYTELNGIMIGKLNSQCLFPPGDDDQSEWAQGERAFWGGVSWICRTPSTKRPPEVNPGLGAEQRQEVLQRRRGASSCESCPLSKAQPDGQGGWRAPDCNGSYELIWWDANLRDYVWVRASGASVPNLREAFSRARRHGWFGQFPARLGTEERKKGIRTFYPATLEFFPREKFEVPVIEMLLRKRKDLMPAVEARVEADNHAEAHAESTQAPPQEPLPAVEEPEEDDPLPAPPPARGRGMRLAPDGTPVLAGDQIPLEEAPPPAPARRSSRLEMLEDDF